MRKVIYISSLSTLLLVIGYVVVLNMGNNSSERATNESIEQQRETEIKQTLDQLTLDEKVGQMILGGIDGTEMSADTESLLRDDSLGGLIFFADNLTSPEQTLQLLNDIKDINTPSQLPLLLAIDEEGGRVSRMPSGVAKLPTSLEVGQRNDRDYSFQIGKLFGKQLNEFGFNMNLAPVLDVNNNPANPVIGDRSFGDEPEAVIEHGLEVMKGIESENIIPTIKHFPGHGDTAVDSHIDLPVISKSVEDLRRFEMLPFQEAIAEGADVVMTAHILLPEIDSKYPATLSKAVLTDILRDELQFDGVIVTDDMTMGGITNEFDISDAAVQTVKAGADIVLVAHQSDVIKSVFASIKAAVNNGEISEERINESVRRIIRLKLKYELHNDHVDSINIDKLNKLIEKSVQ